MGGMEIPRLLLTSDDVHANGIGNTNDLVGRFYMSHIAGTVGSLQVHGPRDTVWHGYDIAARRHLLPPQIALRPEVRQGSALGNLVFRLHHPRITDPRHGTGPLSAIYLAQNFISYEYAKRLVSDTPPTLSPRLRHAHERGGRSVVNGEISHALVASPNPGRAQVSVDHHPPAHEPVQPRFPCRAGAESGQPHHPRHENGRFGNRQVRVDWRYAPLDIETVARSFKLLRADLAERQTGSPDARGKSSRISKRSCGATAPMADTTSAPPAWAPAPPPASSIGTEKYSVSTTCSLPAAPCSPHPARQIRP